MRQKVNNALYYLDKAAEILSVIAKAGKKVMSLCKG